MLEIKPATKSDISILEKEFPSGDPNKHEERLRKQEKGDGTYLVAWDKTTLVGHVFIHWTGSNDEPMKSKLKNSVDIEDVYVKESSRSQGIGSRLIQAAETMAKEKGFSSIGMGVGLDNPRAEKLYQKMGYKRTQFAEFNVSWKYLDENGKEQLGNELCIYLLKDL